MQLGFFDIDDRQNRLSELGDSLEVLNAKSQQQLEIGLNCRRLPVFRRQFLEAPNCKISIVNCGNLCYNSFVHFKSGRKFNE